VIDRPALGLVLVVLNGWLAGYPLADGGNAELRARAQAK
jgi:hypothetical protein